MNVLIVDDDAFARTLLRDSLAELHLDVLEAQDGDEALALAKEHRPGLVLLDLLMPRRSGLEVLSQLAKGAQVLVVSSMDSEALVAQARGAGACGFIAKPFHPLEVCAAVQKALQEARA